MLTIQTTPNLYGISIQGDYLDLNALYDSLSRYLDFYQRNAIAYPYHEYEYLLSLNYDLRHAYMGSRGYALVENNASEYGVIAQAMYKIPEAVKKEFLDVRRSCKKGNLYFQVEILYPLVFHYMVSLDRILDDYYLSDWFKQKQDTENAEDDLIAYQPPYDQLAADLDRANIKQFTSLLWENVRSLFGKELALEVYNCFLDQEEGFSNCTYVDVLLHRMMVNFHLMHPEEKKSFLFLSLIEIMDEPELMGRARTPYVLCQAECRKAKSILKEAKKEFPTSRSFYREFQKAFKDMPTVYHNDFKAFLEKTYGTVPFEEPEW